MGRESDDVAGSDDPGTVDQGPEVFEAFFDREYVLVVGLLIKMGYGVDDAHEAAEEAMAAGLASWGRLRNPAGWVRTVALRTASAMAKRRRSDVLRAVRGGWLHRDHRDDGQVAAVVERVWLVGMLARLTERQRLVMSHFLDGLAPAEIAALTGLEGATVRAHLRDARVRLRTALDEQRAAETR